MLPTTEEEPHKVFVLPSGTSPNARIVSLRNPRSGAKCQYLFCPYKGLFEITRIGPAALDPRSLLFTPDSHQTADEHSTDAELIEPAKRVLSIEYGGYVKKQAEIFVATPFDPVFVLLPLLDRPSSNQKVKPGNGLFQPFDDLLDEPVTEDSHFRLVMSDMVFRPRVLVAMDQICDSVEAGDEQMYRLNMHKACRYILGKAQNVAQQGLPATLEDRFVSRSLDLPMLGVKREPNLVSPAPENDQLDSACKAPDLGDSQSSSTTVITDPTMSKALSGTSVHDMNHSPSAALYYLHRLRTALSFITTSYLDTRLAIRLMAMLPETEGVPDFSPLDNHLELVAKLRSEALAMRSMSDFRKRRSDGDDHAILDRAEKKQKREDEEKKKKSLESRGVRDLKKTNISGMKKMNDFFAKKTSTAEPKA